MAGHRHWGLFGAAGLLLRTPADEPPAVALQLRAERSHHGGTWGILGGARDGDETAVQAALREAGEEATVAPERVAVEATYVDDHGGWAYTTVVATASSSMGLAARNWESDDVRWVPLGEVDALDLHPGFARTWPLLRAVGPAPVVVVDAANVMGSRPDGWWKDRAGAAGRLRDELARASGTGVAGLGDGEVRGLRSFPRFLLVVEGRARDVGGVDGVEVVGTGGSGDDAVVAAVAEHAGSGRPLVVVTADRELRARVGDLGAAVLGPRSLLDLL
ncbi:ADP-ribose pyrophosphatase YjhB, NUDIX family [Friedmanniella luteola]|uniref:ADP-ribose pyrophosphatase YjhB, NUDIX family n=1 Tax=Friedmanniella luteola TaxID=546871 RepID=A0A1H1M2L8_9ACTN|nr:ADP-ribose pyrophosphatase YjhB, NUDIX family [Friedmanniella luteola]